MRKVVRLRHPNIVRVFDFDVENHTPFLVMDYLPNGNVRRSHPKGTPLPLPTIVSYVTQIASALQYAHDEKLIHRDIKPENMLLDRDNTLVLSDFGIALMSQSSRYQSTQEVAGTAAYMAPEQFQGHPRRASDQYALAIVVYEWLTGDRPFHGSFSEIASQHLFVPPPSLYENVPAVTTDVERVVLTALAKDPAARFATVQAFATALQGAAHVSSMDLRSARISGISVGGVPPSSLAVPVDGASPTVQTNEQHVPTLPPKVPSAETVTSVPSPATSFATDGRAAAQAPLSVAQGKKPLPSVPITPSFLPPRMRLPAGRAMVLVLLVLVVVGSGGIWAALYVTTRRPPATPTATTQNIFQMTAVVGHQDSVNSPSIFFALDLQGQATIVELPGGDFTRSRTYLGPALSGSNVSVTLRFQKVIGNSLPDMIVYAGQTIEVFENNGNSFSPVPSSQVPQNKFLGPTSSNANYPLSWTSAVVGHNDSATHPSDFLAVNIRGQIAVFEFRGGDGSKGVVYGGPDLSGSGEDQSVPTLLFNERNHDGKMDMIINVAGHQSVWYNAGTAFIPISLYLTATSDVHLTPTPSGTKAEGSVTFTNQGSVSLDIPTGTLVATRSGILFETVAEAYLPPGSISVPVLASKLGATGNVPANSIKVIPQQGLQAIAQASNLSLDNLHLTVTNDSPTTGGGR